MPGGDALVLLSPGSEGIHDSGETSRENDPPSVAWEIARQVNDWRHVRGWHGANYLPNIHRDLTFLWNHLEWAAANHPAFDAFASDIRRLRSVLMRVTGRSMHVIRSPAPCLDCGTSGSMVREYGDSGLADYWRCRQCNVEVDMTRYWLALAEHLRTLAVGGHTP